MRNEYFALILLALAPAQVNAQATEAGKAPETLAAASWPETAGAPLAAEELDAIAGGDAIVIDYATLVASETTQTLTATVSNNSIAAGSIESGDVNFAPNSLNFHGIGNFVINTGNNNVLQGSLSVTILSGPASP